MNIADFLPENCIIEDLKDKDLESSIKELAGLLSVEINRILSPKEIADSIFEKKDIKDMLKEVSIPPGSIIPHARFDNVTGIGVKGAVGRSVHGIKGIHIIVLLIGDNESADRFVRALALTSDFLREKKNYNSLLKAKDKKEMFEIMREKGLE